MTLGQECTSKTDEEWTTQTHTHTQYQYVKPSVAGCHSKCSVFFRHSTNIWPATERNQKKVHHNFLGDTKRSFFPFIHLFILIIFLLLFSSAIEPKKVHADKLTRNPIATISAIILIIFKQEKEKKFTGIALFGEILSTSDWWNN